MHATYADAAFLIGIAAIIVAVAYWDRRGD
jgi:hypothetical protein